MTLHEYTLSDADWEEVSSALSGSKYHFLVKQFRDAGNNGISLRSLDQTKPAGYSTYDSMLKANQVLRYKRAPFSFRLVKPSGRPWPKAAQLCKIKQN